MQTRSEILITPGHPRWREFLARLAGPEGIDARGSRWRCGGGEDKRQSHRILASMGLSEGAVAANLAYFEHWGGYCDCEVWMNVERSVALGLEPQDEPQDEPEDEEDGW
ncbi:MAG: DUF2695 domain-containing protein [Candidatus Dormibacteraceae bacterium]